MGVRAYQHVTPTATAPADATANTRFNVAPTGEARDVLLSL